ERKKVVLLTPQPPQNIPQPIHHIFKPLTHFPHQYKHLLFIYPIHPNPKLTPIPQKYLSPTNPIQLIHPLHPIHFHNFTNQSYLLLTHSRPIQHHPPTFPKPVFLLTNHTHPPQPL
ncbi:UDP-N-acetylglucosamine 2-epimerase, partial [Staphylococcus aureus]|uniref:UDP-N-acetylglucosamine 2-epimerase n=1 Tax=Staphylococcus aureus TaxID=1280 RepID=UPI0016429A0B